MKLRLIKYIFFRSTDIPQSMLISIIRLQDIHLARLMHISSVNEQKDSYGKPFRKEVRDDL